MSALKELLRAREHAAKNRIWYCEKQIEHFKEELAKAQAELDTVHQCQAELLLGVEPPAQVPQRWWHRTASKARS